MTSVGNRFHGRSDPRCGPAHDRLPVAVDVGDHGIAIDRLDDFFHFIDRREHRCHQAVVVHRDLGHLAPPRTDGLERFAETERSRSDERTVLPETVSHHHVGAHAVSAEQTREGEVGREDGGLRDCGLPEGRLAFAARLLVVGVDENQLGQRAPEKGRHDFVRLTKGVSDDRLRLPKLPQHVDVLRSLARIEKRDFLPRPGLVEDSLRAERLPHGVVRRAEAFLSARRLLRELCGIPVVDGEPLLGAKVVRGGEHAIGGLPCFRPCQHGVESFGELGFRRASEDEHPTHRRFVDRLDAWRSRRTGPTARRTVAWNCDHRARLRLDSTRDVLLQHGVEVRAAESEGAHPGAAHVLVVVPRSQRGVDEERDLPEADLGIGRLQAEARRDLFVVKRECRLEDTGSAGCALQVADVGLDRAERNARRRD